MRSFKKFLAVLLIPVLATGCFSSGATVKQMGTTKKTYHKSKVPNARSKYKH